MKIVIVEDGKYRFMVPTNDYRVHIERAGEPWVVIESGCNAIVALMQEVEELRTRLAEKDFPDTGSRISDSANGR